MFCHRRGGVVMQLASAESVIRGAFEVFFCLVLQLSEALHGCYSVQFELLQIWLSVL